MKSSESIPTRIYVTGLWIIPGNSKRTPKHYFQLLEPTLKIVQNNHVVFYYDDLNILKIVEQLAGKYSIQLTPERLELADLPKFEASCRIAKNASKFRMEPFEAFVNSGVIEKEKGLSHYLKYLEKGKNLSSYELMTCIYLSKPDLVELTMEKFPAQEYIWFDASVSRFNSSRKNADFTKWTLVPGRIHHYHSIMKIFGKSQPLNGSCIGGDKNAWNILIPLFSKYVKLWDESACIYPIDDEPIYAMCYAEQPKLFRDVNFTSRNFFHKMVGKILFVLGLNAFMSKAINSRVSLADKYE